jgi:hypothetical protein
MHMMARDDNPVTPDQQTARLDEYLPLRAAADSLRSGRGDKRIHVATLYRWTERGCRGIRLRYIQIGVTRCTTREWLNEFFAALTRQRPSATDSLDPTIVAPPRGARSPVARRRAIEAADRELDRMGV